jgi:4-aminobutyrate aminotransferase / (S)-3-amino-2-methylpropionate transaminase / 5-aminovalerate transaminase
MSVFEQVSMNAGYQLPEVQVPPPGPAARAWAERALNVNAPMGPGLGRLLPNLVYARGVGANVFDPDGNRFVDLAAGFGAQLLGHCHPEITQVIAEQAATLTHALGDVYPCVEKIELQERLARLPGTGTYRVILGQSGADAVTAALKTALLATGRAGVVTFSGAYHGLGYAPLALCQLRESYRKPFAAQLNPQVHTLPYPTTRESATQTLSMLDELLARETIGAVIVEPILGRGGCLVPPDDFLLCLVARCRDRGALSICDEILTGLGRSGAWLRSNAQGAQPDVICLAKGLGGGLPLSACIAKSEVMQSWAQQQEVVHTSTFAGTPLVAATGLRMLDVLQRDGLVDACAKRGEHWMQRLRLAFDGLSMVRAVRGSGFLIGIDVGPDAGKAGLVCQRLLAKGWIASTGGGTREVVVLTPPLTITDELLDAATLALQEALQEVQG